MFNVVSIVGAAFFLPDFNEGFMPIKLAFAYLLPEKSIFPLVLSHI